MAKRNEGEILATYILWSYTSNNAGQHPVKLRVTHHRRREYYPIRMPEGQKLFMNARDYQGIAETPLEKLRSKNRVLRGILDDAVTQAKEAIRSCTNGGRDPFTFEGFERKYLGQETGGGFLEFFANYLRDLDDSGRAGTHRCYMTVFNQFAVFIGNRIENDKVVVNKDIDPADVTPEMLGEFDRWMRTKKKLVDTTISIRMRCLRKIYNAMAAHDEYLRLKYPFSRSMHDAAYKIPAGSGGQKGQTMTKDELEAFIQASPGEHRLDNPQYRAKQLFLFSLYGQGMNFKDMALLRYSNIQKEAIEFERQKTIRTRRTPTRVRIPLTEELKSILIEQGNPDKRDKSNFVFNVFEAGMDYNQRKRDAKIMQWIKTTNKWLRKYCEANELPVITTYASRHTFASLAKSHLSVAMISEMLGHTKISTTQAYLGRFADSENRAGLMKVFGSIGK